MQLGSIVYNIAALGINVPPFANNGLSITGGVVQLGGPAGGAAAAKLLNNREIPMNGFSMLWSGIGNVVGAHPIFQYDANAEALFEPMFEFKNSAGANIANLRFNTAGSVYLGQNNGGASTGRQNVSIGQNTMAGGTSLLRDSIAIGAQALFGVLVFQEKNVAIGADCCDIAGTTIGNNCVWIGANSNDNASFNTGNNNTCIGSFINNGATVIGAMGDNNTIIGQSMGVGGAIANSGLFGTNMTSIISNLITIGNDTQSVLIGKSVTALANNTKLQVNGNFSTSGVAPLTLGAGRMDFGKIVTAASALNATKYWEISVDGVLVKVCIN